MPLEKPFCYFRSYSTDFLGVGGGGGGGGGGFMTTNESNRMERI